MSLCLFTWVRLETLLALFAFPAVKHVGSTMRRVCRSACASLTFPLCSVLQRPEIGSLEQSWSVHRQARNCIKAGHVFFLNLSGFDYRTGCEIGRRPAFPVRHLRRDTKFFRTSSKKMLVGFPGVGGVLTCLSG